MGGQVFKSDEDAIAYYVNMAENSNLGYEDFDVVKFKDGTINMIRTFATDHVVKNGGEVILEIRMRREYIRLYKPATCIDAISNLI